MERNERIYIPPRGARKIMRGDRWLALWLLVGALFWLGFYLAIRK